MLIQYLLRTESWIKCFN